MPLEILTKNGEQMMKELQDKGGSALYVRTDVAQEQDIDRPTEDVPFGTPDDT